MKALGANIGSMNMTRQEADRNVYYSTETLFNVNLVLKKVRMKVINKTHYRDGQLISSSNVITVNGELHSSSKTEWKGGKYHIVVDEEVKPSVKSPIRFSGSLLYFTEPTNIKNAFSESSGVFMNIKSLKGGKYEVVDPNNNRKMVYHYQNGVGQKVQIKHPLLTVNIIPKLLPQEMSAR